MDEENLNNPEVEEDENIIYLNDENGNEVSFEFLDLIEYDSEQYVVLLPLEDLEDDNGEVVILKLEDSEGEDDDLESYVSVDDENVLKEVFKIFKEKFKDEFNFQDENQDDNA
jgi:uncharacterized protein YrzB (UPF0473 family)